MTTDHATSPLDVRVVDQGTTRRVSPSGPLDAARVDDVRALLDEALASGAETVVLDLEGATRVDPPAVDAVCDALARARREDARFVVLPGPPAVHAVFERCGAADQVPFASALAAR